MSDKNAQLETTEHLRSDMEKRLDENDEGLVEARNKDWYEKE